MSSTVISAVRSRPGVKMAATCATIASAFLVASCSSSGSSSNSTAGSAGAASSGSSSATASPCVQAADAYLKQYGSLPTALPAAFTPLTQKPKPGGSVELIITGTIPSNQQVAAEFAVATKQIGWTFKKRVMDGSVEDLNAKLDDAVADKPTAVVELGYPAAAIQQPIAAAKAAGVIMVLNSTTDSPVSVPGFGVVTEGLDHYQALGETEAYLFMKKSNCKGQVAVLDVPSFPVIKSTVAAFRGVLTKNCPNCKVKDIVLQTSDIGTPGGTNRIVSAFQANTSVKYGFVTFGNVAAGIRPALKQAGLTDVKLFGQVPDETAIKALQDGEDLWWLGDTPQQNAWINLDSILRAVQTKQPQNLAKSSIITVLTPQNISKTSTDVPSYPTDFRDRFKKLWLVG